jgi:hypothetical protein
VLTEIGPVQIEVPRDRDASFELVIVRYEHSSGRLWDAVAAGDRIRITRHPVEYPGSETWIDADAVLADLPAAHELVDAAGTAIRHLTVFVP